MMMTSLGSEVRKFTTNDRKTKCQCIEAARSGIEPVKKASHLPSID